MNMIYGWGQRSGFLVVTLCFLAGPLQAQPVRAPAEMGRRLVEAYNSGDVSGIDALFAEDYTPHENGMTLESRGPQAIRDHVEATREAYPGLTLNLEDLIATEDRVVVRWRLIGTHTDYQRPVDLTGTWIGRIENGRFVEGWQMYDRMTRGLQLGGTYTPPNPVIDN